MPVQDKLLDRSWDKSLADAVRREVPDSDGAGLIVVYDGRCPLCASVSDYIALRDRYGVIRQLDARAAPSLVATMRAAGHDLDRDFAVVRGDHVLFGADGVRALSQAELRPGWLLWAMRRLFGRAGRGTRLYRALNLGRRGLLKLLRRQPL